MQRMSHFQPLFARSWLLRWPCNPEQRNKLTGFCSPSVNKRLCKSFCGIASVQACFREYAACSGMRVRPVELPFNGSMLTGYFSAVSQSAH